MKFSFIACCAFIWSIQPANAQFVQQGTRLFGSGAAGDPGQGVGVAISSDGNTAIVGGLNDQEGNLFVGATWVFTRSSGIWSQQGSKLVGSDAVGSSNQGTSVSLSSDGNTALVGGPSDSNNTGAAWVFVRNAGTWSQQGNKLIGQGAIGINGNQGYSVSLCSDGNTALIGAPGDSNSIGAAWVFTLDGSSWSQQAKLVGTGASAFASQGFAVALSGDGNTALVGGFQDSNAVGAAWVFVRNNGVWTQQGAKLVGTGASNHAQQGYSVALSFDGNTALIGGWADSNYTGAVWVFTRTGTVWNQQGSKLVGTGANIYGGSRQGGSVSLSADGNIAFIGAPGDSAYKGAAWAFIRSNGVWTEPASRLVGTNASIADWQGCAVSLSADGSTAIVGGKGFQDSLYNDLGGAWIFYDSTVLPIQISSFTASAPPGSHVLLEWSTLSEIHNYGFFVQRAARQDTVFLTLPNSFVSGHGTTNQPQSYSFTDSSASPGTWRYRLEQVNLDGTMHYTQAVSVDVTTGVAESRAPLAFILEQNYPNPFNPKTVVRYQVPEASDVKLMVYDLLGRAMATLVNARQQAGFHDVRFDGSELSSGVYVYRLTAGNHIASRRMLLLK